MGKFVCIRWIRHIRQSREDKFNGPKMLILIPQFAYKYCVFCEIVWFNPVGCWDDSCLLLFPLQAIGPCKLKFTCSWFQMPALFRCDENYIELTDGDMLKYK